MEFQKHYKNYKELYLVLLSFLLTGLLGTLLTYGLEASKHATIKYENDLHFARQQGEETIEELNQIISERYTHSLNYIYAIESLAQNQISPEEFENFRSKYLSAKDHWSNHWNLMRVKIGNHFSPQLLSIFYNYENDAMLNERKESDPTYWQNLSITGKFGALHSAIAKAKENPTTENIKMMNDIYESLGFSLYDFFNEMEQMLNLGQLGPFVEPETESSSRGWGID